MGIWMLAAAAALIVAGVTAYRGLWRRWAFAKPVFSYAIGFGTLYLGIGFGLIGVTQIFAMRPQPLWATTLVYVGAAAILLGVLSLFWFPRFLTPRWFRELRAAQKRAIR